MPRGPDHFAWVHQSLRIKRGFDGAHQFNAFPVLLFELVNPVQPNAMFASAGTAEADRPHGYVFSESFGTLSLRHVIGIEDDPEMEVSIADVANQRRDKSAARHFSTSFLDAVDQCSNRYTGIGADDPATRLQRQIGVRYVMTRFPEA